MNSTKPSTSPEDQLAIVLGVPVPASVEPLVRAHIVAVLLFAFLLRLRVVYLPLTIPILTVAGYYEWTLYKQDNTSTARYIIVGLLGAWTTTFLYRLIRRRMLMHSLVNHLSASITVGQD